MIDHITKIYWTDPNDGKTCWKYFVYYPSDRYHWTGYMRRSYTWKDNLPKTVVDFLLNAECVKTEYFEHSTMSPTYKRETYREG